MRWRLRARIPGIDRAGVAIVAAPAHTRVSLLCTQAEEGAGRALVVVLRLDPGIRSGKSREPDLVDLAAKGETDRSPDQVATEVVSGAEGRGLEVPCAAGAGCEASRVRIGGWSAGVDMELHAGSAEAEGHVIPGARRALTRFTDMGVELILAGHLHRAYIGDSLDFLPSEGRESGIVIVQCGTTTSSRGRGRERLKNSLNYIRASRKEIHVTHYLWRDTGGCFQPHSEHRFGTASSAWLEPNAGAGTVSSREEG